MTKSKKKKKSTAKRATARIATVKKKSRDEREDLHARAEWFTRRSGK